MDVRQSAQHSDNKKILHCDTSNSFDVYDDEEERKIQDIVNMFKIPRELLVRPSSSKLEIRQNPGTLIVDDDNPNMFDHRNSLDKRGARNPV